MKKEPSELRRRLGVVKKRVRKIRRAVDEHRKRLEGMKENVVSSREARKRTFAEIEKKRLKQEEKISEMEEYYNERIRYYKPLGKCQKCAARDSEIVSVYKKYVSSLEEIERLRSTLEEVEFKKKIYQSRLAEKKK